MVVDKIKPFREFYDNIHGFIKVTELESKIIDSPFFQRLRNIRQLGLIDYVFPGALHNRFNHSLGVLQIADEMVVSLQENGELLNKRELIRMAALLHDIGHYPLSHLVESVVKDDAKLKIKCVDKDDVKFKIEISEPSTKKDEIESIDLTGHKIHELNCQLHSSINYSANFAHHERMASLVIYQTEIFKILKEGGYSSQNIQDIAQIIAGTYPGPEGLIIHSELDADRFDYLLRDSQQTGVIYGLFDMDQIIRNLVYDPIENRLMVDEKARKAVEHYLMCRYFFYSTVIYHKASVGFEWMAKEIYNGLMERKLVWSYFDLIDLFKDIESSKKFLAYNDSYFFNMLNSVANGNGAWSHDVEYKLQDEFLIELIDKILNRKTLKLVKEEQKLISIQNKEKLESDFLDSIFKKSIIKSVNIEDYWYIRFEKNIDITESSPYRSLSDANYASLDKDQSIKIFKKQRDSITGKRIIEYLVDDNTSIIHVIGNYKLKINRLYTKNDEYKQILNEHLDQHVKDSSSG